MATGLQTKVTKKYIGTIEVVFTSDVFDGAVGDTSVSINGKVLLWISGDDIDDFTDAFADFVAAYAI